MLYEVITAVQVGFMDRKEKRVHKAQRPKGLFRRITSYNVCYTKLLRLSDLAEGQYNFVIFGIDSEELRSETSAFNVSIEEDVTTSVTGIYMPPTIRLDKIQVKNGNILTVDRNNFV